MPTDLQSTRRILKERGLHGQKLLQFAPFDSLDHAVEVNNTTVRLTEIPKHEFAVRIYKPRGYQGPKLPIMCYFHGGFWCGGDLNSEDLGCRAMIARTNNLMIVSFEYRLVPDVTWQECFDDAEAALKWVSENADSLGADKKKGFLIGGATSGAHLAAVCAIRARDHHPSIKLTGQCLIVPVTIAWPDKEAPKEWKAHIGSDVSMADAPVLDAKLFKFYIDQLDMPDEQKRKGENFPCWADLKGLPPAYLPMDECDPTSDQGFLYAHLLRKAGVLTRTDYYEGLPNMFVHYPELATTLTAGIHLGAAVKWLLQDKK